MKVSKVWRRRQSKSRSALLLASRDLVAALAVPPSQDIVQFFCRQYVLKVEAAHVVLPISTAAALEWQGAMYCCRLFPNAPSLSKAKGRIPNPSRQHVRPYFVVFLCSAAFAA